jgi:MFS family permease
MSALSVSVLRPRNFRFFLLMRLCVTTALQAQFVVLGWQVYSLTKSPFMLGLAGLAEAAPAILTGLFAGHVVDSMPTLKITRLAILAFFAHTAGYLIIGGGFTPLDGDRLVRALFVFMALSGVIRSFAGPSLNALLARVVSKKDLPAAAAWQSAGFQASFIIGPALGGLVYGGYGARAAWMLPVLLMGVALAVTLGISPLHGVDEKPADPTARDIRSGWRFIRNNPVLLPAMALDAFSVLFGGATAMLPAYADQILHVGAEGLGALRAAPALGGLAVALALSLYPVKKLSATLLLAGAAGFGLSTIGFGLSTWFPLSLALLVMVGACDTMSAVIRSSIMQIVTPQEMRGRVWSINSMFYISSNEIGAFESGTAARLLGLVPSVVAGGIGTLVVVAIIALRSPKFRKTVIEA